MRVHVASAKRQGVTPPAREPPPPPPEIHRVLAVFHKLCASRTYLPTGAPMALSDRDILAWSQLRGEPLSQVELMLLDLLDRTWLSVMLSKGASTNE